MQGIIIAGTHSGCGKTTVTLGVLAALRKKGLAVQPFKAGPDFIDAGLHRLVAARMSRNLDQWMCGPDYVKGCFAQHCADVELAVVEGVMGLYDGTFNTATLAELLHAPIILVVDASGLAESAGAIVKGFTEFGKKNPPNPPLARGGEGGGISGVIFNRVASENHYRRLKDSVLDVPVFGYLPRELDFEIPHRHLGLTVAEESPLTTRNIERLADTVIRFIDIEGLIECAASRPSLPHFFTHSHPGPLPEGEGGQKIRIAVAYDKAFCFYYEDNLDLLREAGADIIKFSPLADPSLPPGIDAVYIGGGYPELHAAVLSGNGGMLKSLSSWVGSGKPLYAECGGLMYLSGGVRDFSDNFFPMVGVFPFAVRMTKRPRLGYREILLSESCILGSAGEKLRGHEFHYSEIIESSIQKSGIRGRELDNKGQTRIYAVRNNTGNELGTEGFRFKNTLASYVHIHFGSNSRIADHFTAFIKGERTA